MLLNPCTPAICLILIDNHILVADKVGRCNIGKSIAGTHG